MSELKGMRRIADLVTRIGDKTMTLQRPHEGCDRQREIAACES
jgi:hypothetical protein